MRFLVAGVVLASIAVAAAVQEPTRITSVSNARLRASPSEEASPVSNLPLGTLLVPLESSGDGGMWMRVRTTTGQDGWLPVRLTRRFTAANRIQVIERVIQERLARRGDGFTARAELVDLVERTMNESDDAETQGRLALAWLRAMDGALTAVPFNHGRRPPYADWLNAHQDVVVYSEPAGQWMVRSDRAWALHFQHAGTASADDLAWMAVTNGLSGECEGFVPCYARRMNLLEGEYLRRRPAGSRADEAIGRIVASVAGWNAEPYFLETPRDCAELLPPLDALRGAVASTRSARRDEAIGLLDQVRRRCAAKQ